MDETERLKSTIKALEKQIELLEVQKDKINQNFRELQRISSQINSNSIQEDNFEKWIKEQEEEEEKYFKNIQQECSNELQKHISYLQKQKDNCRYQKGEEKIYYNSAKQDIINNLLDNQIKKYEKALEETKKANNNYSIKEEVEKANNILSKNNKDNKVEKIKKNSLDSSFTRDSEDTLFLGYEYLPYNVGNKSASDRAFRFLTKTITWFNYTSQSFLLSRVIRQNAFFYNTADILSSYAFSIFIPEITPSDKSCLSELQQKQLLNILQASMSIIIKAITNCEIDGGAVLFYDKEEKKLKQTTRHLFNYDCDNNFLKKLFNKNITQGTRQKKTDHNFYYDNQIYDLRDVFLIKTAYEENIFGDRSNGIWNNSYFENKIVPMANILKIFACIAEHIQHTSFCVLSDKFYERTMYGNQVIQRQIQQQMKQMSSMLKNDDILRIPLGSEFNILGHPSNIDEENDFALHYWSSTTKIPTAILRGEQDASVLTTAKDQITIDSFNATLQDIRCQYLPQIKSILQYMANCYTDEVIARSKADGGIEQNITIHKEEYPEIILTNLSDSINEKKIKIEDIKSNIEILNSIDKEQASEKAKILSQKISDVLLERLCDLIGVEKEITEEDKEKYLQTIQDISANEGSFN